MNHTYLVKKWTHKVKTVLNTTYIYPHAHKQTQKNTHTHIYTHNRWHIYMIYILHCIDGDCLIDYMPTYIYRIWNLLPLHLFDKKYKCVQKGKYKFVWDNIIVLESVHWYKFLNEEAGRAGYGSPVYIVYLWTRIHLLKKWSFSILVRSLDGYTYHTTQMLVNRQALSGRVI